MRVAIDRRPPPSPAHPLAPRHPRGRVVLYLGPLVRGSRPAAGEGLTSAALDRAIGPRPDIDPRASGPIFSDRTIASHTYVKLSGVAHWPGVSDVTGQSRRMGAAGSAHAPRRLPGSAGLRRQSGPADPRCAKLPPATSKTISGAPWSSSKAQNPTNRNISNNALN
ncbi:unnamed protein product, partial [Iphiclides podalirius]